MGRVKNLEESRRGGVMNTDEDRYPRNQENTVLNLGRCKTTKALLRHVRKQRELVEPKRLRHIKAQKNGGSRGHGFLLS